jgi:hypothetical protein
MQANFGVPNVKGESPIKEWEESFSNFRTNEVK